MPTIKGSEIEITITSNGQPIDVKNAISLEVTDASELKKKLYLGNKRPVEERIEMGWTGRATYEVEDALLEDALDAQIELAEANEDNAVFGIQIAEKYPDGTERRYAYYPCTIKLSTTVGSMTDSITKQLEFSAADRKKIS